MAKAIERKVSQTEPMLEEDLTLIARFLARRDVGTLTPDQLGGRVDLIVLLGSSLLSPLYCAVEALNKGCGERMLISGGIGHSTAGLWAELTAHPRYRDVHTEGRSEAEILAEVAVRFLGVSPELLLIETKSTNCGANATESLSVVREHLGRVNKMILIQDPTMQRRTHASFERAWQSSHVELVSFAPFLPEVKRREDGFVIVGSADPVWEFPRFTSLVLGEIERLRDDVNGYGPRGKNFINTVHVPDEILAAYAKATDALKESRRRERCVPTLPGR